MIMSQPKLSVVIASHDAAGVIALCLQALSRQCAAPHAEVIVADSSSDGTDAIVAKEFPAVRLLHFDAPLTVPELRGKGIAASRGRTIAILDPYSIAAEDWAQNTIATHERVPNAVIGGSVDKHPDSHSGLLSWTMYFNEYGMFMPPVASGPVPIVPGSNVSYKRSLLFDGDQPRHTVFWKTFVNLQAEAGGSPLWLEPAVRVALHKPIPFSDYLHTRFFHGRCFAAMRVEGASWHHRALRALSTPLVPFVLCARWSRVIWRKRRERLKFVCTLPLQLTLFGIWSLGELCGYLFGRGGACRRLFY